MKNVLLFGAVSLLTTISAQADYQHEVSASYIDVDAALADGDGFALEGTMYFDTVDTATGPLSEAAFINKASGLSLTLVDFEDGNTKAIFGRFVLENDYIIEAGYIDTDFDSIIRIGAGIYLTNDSDVVLSYTKVSDSDAETLALDYHLLTPLSGAANISYDLGVSYQEVGPYDGQGISGGLTYYPSTNLGFAAQVALDSVGDSDTKVFGVSAEYFFRENVAASFSILNIDIDGHDEDSIILEVKGRF